jgi:hypothetical protein
LLLVFYLASNTFVQYRLRIIHHKADPASEGSI